MSSLGMSFRRPALLDTFQPTLSNQAVGSNQFVVDGIYRML